MILTDFLLVFRWWILFLSIGLIFLPITIRIFSNFFDKGYIFSKILGIVLVSYLAWLLGSLKVLQFNSQNIFLILITFLLFNLILVKRSGITQLKPLWKIFILEEIIFTIGVFFWAFIKTHESSIHGLEKFMDYGFINSILRSDYFPPKDIWLTPENINYYYFGHLIAALLTKLSSIDSSITFNLMLCSLFGLTLSASFSLGANIYSYFSKNYKLILLAGFLSAFLVTLSGNLQTIYAFFSDYPSENPILFWQLHPMLNSNYWYANATRFIPLTIHEFPLYSFVVSDLHGHVLNIPIVLLILSLLIIIFYQQKINIFYYPLLGLLIAAATMTNALDGPIYLLLTALILLFKKIKRAFLYLTIVCLFTLFFSLPFWINFKPFTSGVGVVCSPTFLTNLGRFGIFLFEENHCQRSPLWMLAIVYGFFAIIFSGYFLITKLYSKKILLTESDKLILIMMLFSAICILIPEFVYIKDIYPAHFRANTVFKFGYQAFIISSIASSFMILRMISQKKFYLLSLSYFFILAAGIFLISLYPFFAVNSYFNSLRSYQGLNGIGYLKDLYPTDFQAISWIRQNIHGQPVILEAQGESYSDFARVSANTGLPTVLGWPVHEWLWRNSVEEINLRKEVVEKLYQSTDLNLTKDLIKKYHISYVFIGILERQKYSKLNEEKFNILGKIIYQNNQTSIYQLNN